MTLPVSAHDWHHCFESHLVRDRTVEEAFDEARVCRLEFRAEELGESLVDCEREFVPVRWSVRRRGGGYMVRLHDDSGASGQATVTHAAFETPMEEQELRPPHEYEGEGMYIARRGGVAAAIVVPPAVRSLADLRCTPRIESGPRSLEAILRLLSAAHLWGRARLTRAFSSAQRKRDVMQELERHITGLVCGDRWASAERLVKSPDGAASLADALSQHSYEREIGLLLAEEGAELAAKPARERVEYLAALVTKYHLVSSSQGGADWDPYRLSELALRIASDPAGVVEWAGEGVRGGLSSLMELGTIARASRLLVLTIHQSFSGQVPRDNLYAAWDWE